MYLIERIPILAATFLAGSVPEPSARETEWVSGGTYAVGVERTRTSKNRVYKCAVARSPGSTPPSTTPPEDDPTGWQEMRPTDRWVPFGPYINAAGQTVYRSLALDSTTADLTYRLQLRYCNAVALFGLRGARVRVRVYATAGGTLAFDKAYTLKQPAAGYWDYAYGPKVPRDRLMVTGLPIYPAAEVRIDIEGSGSQQRRVTQIEAGKLRYIPGASFGGAEYGVTSTVRARMYRKQDDTGTEAVLLYGASQDLQGQVVLTGDRENAVLHMLRGLVGKGVAVVPHLSTGYEQRLVFGVIDVAPLKRTHLNLAAVDVSVRGLPVD
jgi:hypothetical protein